MDHMGKMFCIYNMSKRNLHIASIYFYIYVFSGIRDPGKNLIAAIGYNDPNSNARKYHSKEYLEDPMLNTAITHLKEGEWLRDIGDGITLYDKYWTELKTIR